MEIMTGIPASSGLVTGPVFLYERPTAAAFSTQSDRTAEQEHWRFEQAAEQAKEQLEKLYEKTVRDAGESAAQIFHIHKMMLEDLDWLESISINIYEKGYTAEYAVTCTATEFTEMFSSLEDEVMQARSADVRDLCQRLLAVLSGKGAGRALTAPRVIAAADMLPSDTMQLEKRHVLAFVTEQGSYASHSAILARTMGIPAVVGVPGLMDALSDGRTVIVDGSRGRVILDPDEETLQTCEARRTAYLKEQEDLRAFRDKESITRDGVRIEVCANIGCVADADSALAQGADGVGLMRSEFLYLDAAELPDEAAQVDAYSQVLRRMNGKRVVVRTLDIGADKVPSYLPLPHEENSALGCRAIRLCFAQPDVFRTQLRALLRASVYGTLAIMFPMISKLEELHRAKAVLKQCQEELRQEGIPFSQNIEVGMMVEVPSAAIMSDRFAAEVDFFSIGTNDLTQYTLAADRLNEKVAALFDYGDEAVLRLVAHTAKSAAAHGIWCGICGESAAKTELLPFYAKAGIRELSVVPGKVLEIRRAVTQLDTTAL